MVEFTVAPSVKLGGYLEYRLLIKNTSRRSLRALFDYAILHRKANGGLSPKVFKGRIKELAAGESWEIKGRHPVKLITTRVYYAGLQQFEPRLNGKATEPREFLLET